MNRKFLLIPLLLLAVMVQAEPIVRVVNSDGSNKAFATDNVRKLVLSDNTVDVVSKEGSVLLSVLATDIARVEFTDGVIPTELVTTQLQEDKTLKIIENGQVYILHKGKKYTIMGVEIENNNQQPQK